ncbi:MAG TPA: TMEM175 family protein [Candidatus Sulfotelmatobacter sp.]|jgi:uncharacterized membrane protein|nr:TMEM175 family protein [Candidatus Sulfotelmatobacter sp.]
MTVAHMPDHSRMRVDLFSDAVFAVAITLLVLNLPVTNVSGSLLSALAERWAAFAAFGISFVIIGCVWVSHFRLFRTVEKVDERLLFLNLALLLTIVLVPFGTSTMATFVTRPDAQSHPAAALFAGTMVLMGLAFAALYSYVNPPRHQPASVPQTLGARLAQLRPMTGLFVNTVGIGVAFISPIAVLVMTASVALFYIFDELTCHANS